MGRLWVTRTLRASSFRRADVEFVTQVHPFGGARVIGEPRRRVVETGLGVEARFASSFGLPFGVMTGGRWRGENPKVSTGVVGTPHDALVALLVELRTPLVAAVRVRAGCSREDAEDCVQEAIAELLDAHAELWPDVTETFTWLRRRAISRYIDSWRRQKRLQELLRLIPEPETPMEARDTAELLAARERWQALAAAIDDLPPLQRTVVVLGVVEGLTIQQVAVRLGVDANTVSARQSRAAANLARALRRRGLSVILPAVALGRFVGRALRSSGPAVPALALAGMVLAAPLVLVDRAPQRASERPLLRGPDVLDWTGPAQVSGGAPSPPKVAPPDLRSSPVDVTRARPGTAPPVGSTVCAAGSCATAGRVPPGKNTAYVGIPGIAGEDPIYLGVEGPQAAPVCPLVPTTPVSGCTRRGS